MYIHHPFDFASILISLFSHTQLQLLSYPQFIYLFPSSITCDDICYVFPYPSIEVSTPEASFPQSLETVCDRPNISVVVSFRQLIIRNHHHNHYNNASHGITTRHFVCATLIS
jgi:hypothetical protein